LRKRGDKLWVLMRREGHSGGGGGGGVSEKFC